MKNLTMTLAFGAALAALPATAWPARADEAEDACVEGILRLEKNKAREALALFNKAIQLDPRSAVAYAYRARAHADLGRLKQAWDDCTTALRLDDRLGKAYHHRGCLLHLAGRRKPALANFTLALRLDPRDAQVYNDRGTVRLELGDLRGCLGDFDQAIALQPDLAEAYGNRACAKFVLGMTDEAREDFAECFKREPELRPYFQKQVAQFQTYFKLRKAVMGQIKELAGGLAD